MGTNLNPQECKVAVLSGGKSKERDISLVSGEKARAALDKKGFVTTAIDPANPQDLVRLIEEDFDVAFMCLHGRYGEDGTMQGFLELIELPYTGSGVWASALAIDKVKSKVFYERVGLKTPQSAVVVSGDGTTAQAIVEKVGLPCVVKPPKEGSSFGINIASDVETLERVLAEVLESDGEALIETYIKGTELTVPVLGNDEPYALPVIEIVPANEFYDFAAKYETGGSEHICPARIDEAQTKAVQELGVRAHEALECRGISRSDFILDEKGQFWILETNTLPGMTDTSLLPDAARVAGREFPELCAYLVELALE